MNNHSTHLYKLLYRKKIRSLLKTLSPSERKAQSRNIFSRLCQHPDFEKAQTVFVYSALPSEVQTELIMKEALRTNKKLLLPRINNKSNSLELYEVKKLNSDLISGSFGVMEPDSKKCRRATSEEVDLWILPGLGFDTKGRRLGRGAGYFDRLFEKIKSRNKWALAYREQMFSELPAADHDVRMDIVWTGDSHE